MTRLRFVLLFLFLVSSPAVAGWKTVAPGVEYRTWQKPLVAYAVRIDLHNPSLRVIATDRDDNGARVSEFAAKHHAIAAINGDYFDDALRPIGLAIGECGTIWNEPKAVRKEGLVAVEAHGVKIVKPGAGEEPEEWMRSAVAGWPMLVDNCVAYDSKHLPGSDSFTRSLHPRTAVGLSKSGRYLFFVVIDGRSESASGATLAQLGGFMRKRLGVCRAINLDGGGSSAMWIDGKIVNHPSDGSERKVGNHLAVVKAEDAAKCRGEK